MHARAARCSRHAPPLCRASLRQAEPDAWKPYDSFENVAGHALCGAHVLRELAAVTETGAELNKAWAQQAIDALLALDEAAGAARAAGKTAVAPETLAEHEDWYRKAAAAGTALNAGRRGKL